MNLFDAAMEIAGKPALRRAFGYDAVYARKDGSQISTWVMPSTDLGFAGQRNIRADTQLSVEIPTADLGADPQPGDQLTFKNQTYRVDQLLDTDGLFYRVAIR